MSDPDFAGDPSGPEARSAGRRADREGTRGDSYYGLPVLNEPVWKALDIAGYLFLGGLAGAS
ncbi:MAG TPA: hypothetical protein VFR49_08630, partial [Solirubrobacteraceae bacterium]|nr:hypothetical protein [Solirubrobacteraceae bacterium]